MRSERELSNVSPYDMTPAERQAELDREATEQAAYEARNAATRDAQRSQD